MFFSCLGQQFIELRATLGYMPRKRERPALLRPGCIDGAVVAIQKCTTSIGLIQQGELPAVRCQTRMPVDEFLLAQAQIRSQSRDVFLFEKYRAPPPTALTAPRTGELL